MIRNISMVLSLALVLGLVGFALAEKEEAKTLEGTICCAKCELKVEGQTKCHTVIKVKDGDKDVIYWFDADGSKKYHKEICQETKQGKVTGTIGKDGDKKTIKVTKVEFK
jgi:hypothetical protein